VAAMLDKCANLGCPEEFRSLRRGRLFVMDTAPRSLCAASPTVRRKPHKLEYFWLCAECCKSKRVVADVNHHIIVASMERDEKGRGPTISDH